MHIGFSVTFQEIEAAQWAKETICQDTVIDAALRKFSRPTFAFHYCQKKAENIFSSLWKAIAWSVLNGLQNNCSWCIGVSESVLDVWREEQSYI